MSQYSWYGLESKLEKQFNEGKDFSNRYVSKRYVYFKDYLEIYQKTPEVFNPSMVADMSAGLIYKINALFTYHKNRNDKSVAASRKELFENILQTIRNNGAEYDSSHRSLVAYKGVDYTASFSSDMSWSFSKGKKTYISEVKKLMEDLSVFNKVEWNKDIPSSLILQNINGNEVFHSIAFKNLIISLPKFFPNLKEDEQYNKFKDDFFNGFYDKFLRSDRGFTETPFSDVISFLRDSYNEDALKKLVVLAGEIVEYSYLKNKSSFDKVMAINESAKEILKDFVDAIKDEKVPDFFIKESHQIVSFSLDIKAVQKILLLDKVKVYPRDISSGFNALCESERSKSNPLAWFMQIDHIKNDAVECKERWLFKVPKDQYDMHGEGFIRKFLEKTFLNYVNEFPNPKNLGKNDLIWNEFILAKDNESLPEAKSSAKVNKF